MKVFFLPILLLMHSSICLEYKKNSDILNSAKYDESRTKEIENLEEVQRLVDNKNAIVVFHAEWCGHCKDFLPKFFDAGRYKLGKNIEFISVNCKNRAICDHFGVNRFPTTKVFIKGEELKEEPPRNLEALLEFIDKITSAPIKILNENEISEFSNNYGDVSFLIVSETKGNDFYQCIENLSEKHYKGSLYFGYLEQKNYITKFNREVKSPSLVTLGVNENYNFIFNQKDYDCSDIKNFIDSNKFPLIKKLETGYIKRLQNEKKIVLSLVIDKDDERHLSLLQSTFLTFALENRNYVFTFTDYNEDTNILRHLGISQKNEPTLFIYNFENFKFYVDEHLFSLNEDHKDHLSELIVKIEKKEINLTSGNFVEDFLSKFGLKLDDNVVIYFVAGLCFIVLIIFLVLICCFGNGINENPKQIKKQNEEIKKNEDSKIEKKNQ